MKSFITSGPGHFVIFIFFFLFQAATLFTGTESFEQFLIMALSHCSLKS